MTEQLAVERQTMDVDVVCVGFGPATAGFLHTLSQRLMNEDGTPALESRVMPGMPLQVMCYERADDIGFGVSGVVTLAKGIRDSIPDLTEQGIPMLTPVKHEKVAYLLDPIGASRRPWYLKMKDAGLKTVGGILPWYKDYAFELPYHPPFLKKHGGLLMSLGQFTSWVGAQVMGSGLVQVWPGMPVAEPLVEDSSVKGVRLADQGVAKDGSPEAGFMPGMDLHAALTVVGDGPVGPVGRKLDELFGLPADHHQRDYAVGMKMVVDLPEHCTLEEGTVIHTFGYPEPDLFGFMYVYPDRVASLGIFVPSTFDTPVRTTYRYLQHWMMHPYLWQHIEGGTLRSWGAKTLGESGLTGAPHLVGNGYARIGEGSGSTNMLTGSGVDEAWTTGVQLAEAVAELAKDGKEFTQENLDAAYVARRKASWLQKEGQVADKARAGFERSFAEGMLGMALSGYTRGLLKWPGKYKPLSERMPTTEEYYKGIIPPEEIAAIKQECFRKGQSLHDALMMRAGWPEIPFDGQLLVSHQDALLMGGKVQAPAGFADHVVFTYPNLCEQCGTQLCTEICSAQAITPNPEGGVPEFDREKCVHCGACIWNCTMAHPDDPEKGNVQFTAGAGGLHSAEN